MNNVRITLNDIREGISYLFFKNPPIIGKDIDIVIPILYHCPNIDINKIRNNTIKKLNFNFNIYNDFLDNSNIDSYKYFWNKKFNKCGYTGFAIWWKLKDN